MSWIQRALPSRLLREAQAGAFARFTDSVQLDGLRVAPVAGRAVATGDPPDAAAVGAGVVFRAAHEADAFADGTIPNSHACCVRIVRRILRLPKMPGKNAATINTNMRAITIRVVVAIFQRSAT